MREFIEKNGAPQSRGADFARARAGEMHMGISEEAFYARILRKSVAPQNCGADFDASLRRRYAFGHLKGAILCQNSQETYHATDGTP